jgi:RNA polymerase sigma-54 factor
MLGPALAQKQQLNAIPVQIQANAILAMNALELQQFIETEAAENPALALQERERCPVCGFATTENVCPICGTSVVARREADGDNLDEHDLLSCVFAVVDNDHTYDPFNSVASHTSLADYLKQQARMVLGARRLRIAEFLIDSLDEDGYFREPLFDVAEEFAVAVPDVEAVLEVVQSFDPPGVAARDLRECLLIQLRSMHKRDELSDLAERIITDYWEDLSRARVKSLAAKLSVGPSTIAEVSEFIRERLNPRPASAYRPPYEELTPRRAAVIVPDVVVRSCHDTYVAEVVGNYSSMVTLDKTYEAIYELSREDGSRLTEEEWKHVKEHVERVKGILEAISLRKKTIARVANYLVDYQQEFLAGGASYLKPLRQKDVAKALEIHESTVCRALANKYCRLPSGEVVSFEVFFDSALPVREMIGQIIARSIDPLSDSQIARALAAQGVSIARRTVAKYRQQLNVLPYNLRAA